ncbi:MAG: glycosyltransferase [Anaerolineae bacterium]|nr:glycosyltransferase [Anaerolineae bacterium]
MKIAPDVTLITSLYRGEAHLPAYGERVRQLLAALAAAGLALEVLVVANAATPAERSRLAALPVRVLHTDRETLYASWNRGVAAAGADIFGFWNVDDARDPAALVAACAHLRAGFTLVDAPLRVVQTWRRFGRTWQRQSVRPVPYDPVAFSRHHGLGPFALLHRDLYAQVGGFDAHFRIAGDLEWGGRAQAWARFTALAQPGGTFYLHGGNLSSTGSPLQAVEDNIIFLRRRQWSQLRPAEPVLMQSLWDTWGSQGAALPAAVADWLWGPGAAARYARYRQEQRLPRLAQRGLLSLARRGLLHSEIWALRHTFPPGQDG